MMKATRFYLLTTTFIAVLFLSVIVVNANSPCNEPCPATVVFVVDVFDVNYQDPPYSGAIRSNIDTVDLNMNLEMKALPTIIDNDISILPPDKLCAISPDGQDGAIIDGSPELLTSRLRPFTRTHGDYVFAFMQRELQNRAISSLANHQYTYPVENIPWIPRMEIWEADDETLRDRSIILVQIDTQGYTANLISLRISSAMDFFGISGAFELGSQLAAELRLDRVVIDEVSDALGTVEIYHNSNESTVYSVEDIVINMSFVLIPCNDIPTISFDDYVSMATGGFTSTADRTDEDEVNQFIEDLSEHLVNAQKRDFYIQHILPQFHDPTQVYDWYFHDTNSNAPADWINVYQDAGIPMIGGMEAYPIRELLLTRCLNFRLDGERSACIPVASAGNFDTYFPFAPAMYDGVLGVGAHYNRIDERRCNEIRLENEATGAFDVVPALTNRGAGYVRDGVMTLGSEINQNIPQNIYLDEGVFYRTLNMNCVYGTSFAAPVLAIEAATLPYDISSGDYPNFDFDGDGIVGNDGTINYDKCPEEGIRIGNNGCS